MIVLRVSKALRAFLKRIQPARRRKPVVTNHQNLVAPLPPHIHEQLDPFTQLYYFGSFNPVHLGHLYTARHALTMLAPKGFRQVVFIPTPTPPNKIKHIQCNRYTMYAMEQRLALLELAFADWGIQQTFKALPLEAYAEHRQTPTYTAETLAHAFTAFFKRHRQQRLYLLMGQDTFLDLETWQQLDWLVDHVHFVVFPRAGKATNTTNSFKQVWASHPLKARFGERMVWTFLQSMPMFPMNATAIRQQPHSVGHWMTPTVASRIQGKT
jgi:nicotinate-nucleotide adenylyltransferase